MFSNPNQTLPDIFRLYLFFTQSPFSLQELLLLTKASGFLFLRLFFSNCDTVVNCSIERNEKMAISPIKNRIVDTNPICIGQAGRLNNTEGYA